MARLFFSLYIVIALSLILLAAAMDNLFYTDSPQVSPPAESIGIVFRELYPKHDISKLATNADIQMSWKNPKSMAWPDAIAKRLNNGKPVLLHDNIARQQLYVQMRDGRLLELTFKQQSPPQTSYLLYSSLFFILLSIPLALWVWPLWRDLNALKAATQTLHGDGSLSKVELSAHSPLKPIADAFNQLSLKIKQLLLNKRELTGAVAHEFRTPLARLKFALALKPQVGASPWKAMREDVDELESLVQEMLDYSSMETSAPEMDMSEIPLKQISEDIVNKMAYQHSIHLHVEGHDHIVLADAHFVQRSLQNLLQNALRYAHQEIVIRILRQHNTVIIHVDDDGPGIDEQMSERIFDPFFRPDSSRDRLRGGAGLGLAIVRRIQQWHGGTCTVETSPLGGARFILTYPALDSLPNPPSSSH